jgi:hypothetical protein
MSRTIVFTVIALALAALSPAPALADGPAATSMRIAVPPRVQLGQPAQVQAQLLDAQGKPVAGALIRFTAPLAFLEAAGDVVLDSAKTNASGIATGRIALRTEGPLEVSAAFDGDAQHAPSSAKAPVEVQGSQQLYAQAAGVKLPGLNEAPSAGGPNAGLVEGLSALWPRLSGWPVALALMIIWSLYGSVVVILFRITAAAKRRVP